MAKRLQQQDSNGFGAHLYITPSMLQDSHALHEMRRQRQHVQVMGLTCWDHALQVASIPAGMGPPIPHVIRIGPAGMSGKASHAPSDAG